MSCEKHVFKDKYFLRRPLYYWDPSKKTDMYHMDFNSSACPEMQNNRTVFTVNH